MVQIQLPFYHDSAKRAVEPVSCAANALSRSLEHVARSPLELNFTISREIVSYNATNDIASLFASYDTLLMLVKLNKHLATKKIEENYHWVDLEHSEKKLCPALEFRAWGAKPFAVSEVIHQLGSGV